MTGPRDPGNAGAFAPFLDELNRRIGRHARRLAREARVQFVVPPEVPGHRSTNVGMALLLLAIAVGTATAVYAVLTR